MLGRIERNVQGFHPVVCDNVDKPYYPGLSNMNESVALIPLNGIYGLISCTDYEIYVEDYHGTKISDIDKVCDLDNLGGIFFPVGLGKTSSMFQRKVP